MAARRVDAGSVDWRRAARQSAGRVSGGRLLRILTQLSAPSESPPGTRRLCEVAAEVTEMSGAGIMLVSGTAMQGSLCRTDRVSGILEDLQYDLGEGPCVDAHNLGTPVLEPDLASPATARWTAFSPRAVESGARAVFGFPVRVGAARLGALNLYSDRPGPLSEEQHADALVLADVAARAILTMQAGAEPGELASELEADGNFQFVVHQAAGMVSVQLGISIGEAIVRLRAFAFRTDRLTADVARDVVSRRLRFDDSTEGAGAAPGPGP